MRRPPHALSKAALHPEKGSLNPAIAAPNALKDPVAFLDVREDYAYHEPRRVFRRTPICHGYGRIRVSRLCPER